MIIKRIKGIITKKYCKSCGKTLSIDNFYKYPSSIDGYAYECKKCRSIIEKEWRDSHKEYIKERSRKYGLEHKEEIKRRYRERYAKKKALECLKVLKETDKYILYTDESPKYIVKPQCIKCKKCNTISYNTKDIAEEFCSNCNEFYKNLKRKE